jgi:sulfite reductase alpha subunit-like flavoprotein
MNNLASFLQKIFWGYHGALPFTLLPLFLLLHRRGKAQGQLDQPKTNEGPPKISTDNEAQTVTILYSTTTGTARKLSEELLNKLQRRATNLQIRMVDLKDYETDNLENEQIVLFLCSTWTDGTLAETAQPFLVWLEDVANDFRISKMFLGKIRYGIFGLGGRIYGDNFCKAVSRPFSPPTSLSPLLPPGS